MQEKRLNKRKTSSMADIGFDLALCERIFSYYATIVYEYFL